MTPAFDATAALARSNVLVRELTALPPNELTPRRYRERLRKLARAQRWDIEEFDYSHLRKLGAGAFTAVAQGSGEHDAAIVHLSYAPKNARLAVALVGKGICFDTGGHNLKSAKYMAGMHEDMNGSAVALGLMQALAEQGFPLRVDAWLALVRNSFGNLESAFQGAGIAKVNGLVLDLGVSSMQFDEADRGFSFRVDAPLDMRMDRTSGQTAADLVNTLPQDELANLIYLYGEERKSRHIAAAIVKARMIAPIRTTKALADIIRSVVYVSPRDKIAPSTRTFEALRIAVNDEVGELESVLAAAERVVEVGGRLAVVTFHSLEDRIVKNFLQERSRPAPAPSRHVPFSPLSAQDASPHRLSFSLVTKKPVLPTDDEMKRNPRSRSAKLRAAIRLEDV